MNSIELSVELLSFLEQKGYSHILSLGAAQTENGPEGGKDNYYLKALKNDDPLLSYQETDFIINPINSREIEEMAGGVDGLRFIIQLPAQDLKTYLNF